MREARLSWFNRIVGVTAAATLMFGLTPAAALATPTADDTQPHFTSIEGALDAHAVLDGFVDDGADLASQGGDAATATARATYPAQFDLRAADLGGSGVLKNYVTPIKNQDPFGTC